mgnify:CR=1 FL=1
MGTSITKVLVFDILQKNVLFQQIRILSNHFTGISIERTTADALRDLYLFLKGFGPMNINFSSSM